VRLIVTLRKAQEELDQAEVLYGASQGGAIRWEAIVEVSDILTGRVSLADVHDEKGITFLKNPAHGG
jgi:hypothetical protein